MDHQKNLVKICAYMRVHEAKTSACVYAQCQNVLTRIYASCAHIFPSNLIVHYYVMTLNFKLVRDPRYFQNNADHAHKMHKCRCTLSTSACACFRFICARICTDLYQNFHGGPLLFCAVRFFFASTVGLKFGQNQVSNSWDIWWGLFLTSESSFYKSHV